MKKDTTMGMLTSKFKEGVYGLKKSALLEYNNLVKKLLLMIMHLTNTLQVSGGIKQKQFPFC